MPNEEWVFWLGITNIALVAIVLLVALVVAYAVISEVLKKRKSSTRVADLNEELSVMLKSEFTHGLTVPGLGLTMADGGDRRAPLPEQSTEKKHS